MAPYDNTDGPDRFNSFDVYRTSYKKIGDYEIEVGILIPKDIDTAPGKKHPLFVKFHGGGLVSSQYPTRLDVHPTDVLSLSSGKRHLGLPQLVRKLACPARPP